MPMSEDESRKLGESDRRSWDVTKFGVPIPVLVTVIIMVGGFGLHNFIAKKDAEQKTRDKEIENRELMRQMAQTRHDAELKQSVLKEVELAITAALNKFSKDQTGVWTIEEQVEWVKQLVAMRKTQGTDEPAALMFPDPHDIKESVRKKRAISNQ